MTECSACRQPGTEERPLVRTEALFFHTQCAPRELIESASEEYRAILRKGVRYFVEKYSVDASAQTDPAEEFLRLGNAIEAERSQRT
jgi:hypothetical protein